MIAAKTCNDWVNRVVREYEHGLTLALFFDYDGTLTPIVPHPSLARLSPATRERLHTLATLPRVEVGIISGRALAEVRSMVGLEGVYYAGSGGLEIDLLGRIERYPETDSMGSLLESIQDGLVGLLRQYPGTWLERKPGAIALHFRGLLPLAACCFRLDAVRLLSATEGLRIKIVSEAIEVTPQDGWDKGTAVVSMLKDMQDFTAAVPLVIYFGDSINDTEGMTVAVQMGGVAIGIGAEAPPMAVQQLTDSSELTGILEELANRLAMSQGLPLVHVEEETNSKDQPSKTGSAETGTGECHGDFGLLVLDPDVLVRTEFAASMSTLGWRVWQAGTSEQASALLDRHHDSIRIVLADLGMPGLQGATALVAVGRKYPQILRCFVSADVSHYLASAFHRLSEIPLMVKPIRPQECDFRFRAWLRGNAEPNPREHQLAIRPLASA